MEVARIPVPGDPAAFDPESGNGHAGLSRFGGTRLRRPLQGLPRHERAETPVRLAAHRRFQPDIGSRQNEPVDQQAACQHGQER